MFDKELMRKRYEEQLEKGLETGSMSLDFNTIDNIMGGYKEPEVVAKVAEPVVKPVVAKAVEPVKDKYSNTLMKSVLFESHREENMDEGETPYQWFKRYNATWKHLYPECVKSLSPDMSTLSDEDAEKLSLLWETVLDNSSKFREKVFSIVYKNNPLKEVKNV